MKVTTYTAAQDFLDRVQATLEQDEPANNVILGVAANVARGIAYGPHPPYFATVEDEHGLALAAMMTPPHNLSLYGQADRWLAALEPLAVNLRGGGWPVPGVLGRIEVAEGFARVWSRVAGVSWWVNMRQRIYALTEVVASPPPPGHFRPATQDDLDLVTDWAVAFEREALAGEPDRVAAWAGMARRIGDQGIYLWDDGGPVSMAAWGRPMKHSVIVNLVYTPPDLRGKGYASAVVAHLSQLLLDRGFTRCVLHTDLANPTSNSIYQRIGYRPVLDSNEYRFG